MRNRSEQGVQTLGFIHNLPLSVRNARQSATLTWPAGVALISVGVNVLRHEDVLGGVAVIVLGVTSSTAGSRFYLTGMCWAGLGSSASGLPSSVSRILRWRGQR